jgi:multisubunit Na+/H+ antiporter MnhG subunit
MSSLPADIAIWILLFAGILFSGIGLMGQLIFPDTMSRMFTAFRATAISLGAVTAAVLVYGIAMLQGNGGGEYLTLIIHTLVFTVVIAACMLVMHRIIGERIGSRSPGCVPDGTENSGD